MQYERIIVETQSESLWKFEFTSEMNVILNEGRIGISCNGMGRKWELGKKGVCHINVNKSYSTSKILVCEKVLSSFW